MLVFSILGSYFYWTEKPVLGVVFFLTSFLIATITWLKSEYLSPLNRSWAKFGEILGKVVNPIVIGLIFFGLITPLAIFLRIIGRDELKLKQHLKTETFWTQKADQKLDGDSFKNQF